MAGVRSEPIPLYGGGKGPILQYCRATDQTGRGRGRADQSLEDSGPNI